MVRVTPGVNEDEDVDEEGFHKEKRVKEFVFRKAIDVKDKAA